MNDSIAWLRMSRPDDAATDAGIVRVFSGSNSPSVGFVYVAGYWTYQNARYAWRPGYWSPYRAGRMWVAPRYVWTPSGYVFVDGYWDYPLENRGMIFASVAFTQPVYLQANYVYRPRFVISKRQWSGSLAG